MNQKFSLRALALLLAVTLGVMGFFLYRSRSLQAASNTIPSLLKDLKLDENISLPTPYLQTPDRADYAALKKKDPKDLQTGTRNREMQKVLLHEVGKQLRMGDVKFATVPPLQEDGYRPPPSEEEQKAGKLTLTPHLTYVKGLYVGHIRLQLDQPIYLKGASSPTVLPTWSEDSLNEFSTTAEAEIIPKFQAEARNLTTKFIRDYRVANGLPVPEMKGGAPASPAGGPARGLR